MINVKRAYDEPARNDGERFLIDRVWPRGVTRDDLRIAGWLRDLAPSTPLRKWFAHDPAKWDEFRRRYAAELDRNPEAWKPLLQAGRHGQVTLVYGARDTEHNNAVALKEYLEKHRR